MDLIFEELELAMKKSLEEKSAQGSCEEGTSGPWVKKGNPIGFLDSECKVIRCRVDRFTSLSHRL